jgi:hypothetical protein
VAELHQLREALLVGESGDHTGEVANGGDGGADGAAKRLAGGTTRQVVVAAGACRLVVELQVSVTGAA